MKDKLTGIDKDKLISYEIIGKWPIYKMTLRDILFKLNAIEYDGLVGFNINDPILNICPMKLEDDGMGYGINKEWITCADTDEKTYINLFVEKELSKEKLNEYIKEQTALAKEIKEYYENRRQLELSEK